MVFSFCLFILCLLLCTVLHYSGPEIFWSRRIYEVASELRVNSGVSCKHRWPISLGDSRTRLLSQLFSPISFGFVVPGCLVSLGGYTFLIQLSSSNCPPCCMQFNVHSMQSTMSILQCRDSIRSFSPKSWIQFTELWRAQKSSLAVSSSWLPPSSLVDEWVVPIYKNSHDNCRQINQFAARQFDTVLARKLAHPFFLRPYLADYVSVHSPTYSPPCCLPSDRWQ